MAKLKDTLYRVDAIWFAQKTFELDSQSNQSIAVSNHLGQRHAHTCAYVFLTYVTHCGVDQ